MGIVGPKGAGDLVGTQQSPLTGGEAHRHPAQHRRSTGFIVEGVGARLAQHLVARAGVQADGELVCHGAAGHKHRGFFAEQRGAHALQPQHRRVLAEDIVADLGIGNGLAHGRTGPGHGV